MEGERGTQAANLQCRDDSILVPVIGTYMGLVSKDVFLHFYAFYSWWIYRER